LIFNDKIRLLTNFFVENCYFSPVVIVTT